MTKPTYIAVPFDKNSTPNVKHGGFGQTIEEALTNLKHVWPAIRVFDPKQIAVFAGAPVSGFNQAEREFMSGRPVYADLYLNGLVCLVDVSKVVTYTKHTSVVFDRTGTDRNKVELAAWSESQPWGSEEPKPRMTWRQAAEAGCLVQGDVPRGEDAKKYGIFDQAGPDGGGLFHLTNMARGVHCRSFGYDSFVVDISHHHEPIPDTFIIFTPT